MDRRQNRKQNMRQNLCWRLSVLFLMLTVLFSLAGCKDQTAAAAGAKAVEAEYTRGQIMVIGATERNRYQNVYSSALWEVMADASGETFEDKLKEQMEQFLTELATMNMMAKEKGVELTGQEQDRIKALSQEYYEGLSEADLSYMNVSQDEVYELYSQYYLADKLVTELTDGQNLEVSDAEAKVIEVLRIELSTEEKAQSVLEQVQEEKADFAAIAAKQSENSQISYSLEWNQEMDALSQCAFSLEQDEISSIVEQDGAFYIQKCVNAYNAEATAARKSILVQEKRTTAFLQIYEPYAREHQVKLKEGIWDKVDFQKGEECITDNFFELYHSYFSR